MLVLPALLALVFVYVRMPSWELLATIAAAAGAMTLIHPPHSALVLIVLAGFLFARVLLNPRGGGPLAAAVAAVAVPTAAVGLWLLPIVRDTVAHNPGHAELRRAFANYPYELDVFGLHSYRLKPELFGRTGAVAIAALVLLPLALFAPRRLWSAFVLGGLLLGFSVALSTFLFPHLADAVSISPAWPLVGFTAAVTGYELVAALPVYLNATPPAHSSDTRANHPARRVRDAQRLFKSHGSLSVLRRYGAGWLLVDRKLDGITRFQLPRVWTNGRYVLYKVQ